MQTSQWTDTLVQLLSLALRLESEGQYDIAKLARAQADAISRRAAWELNLPNDKETLASDIERIAAALDDADLQAAFRAGASALTSGRVPLIEQTPHPYVCRTCGHLALTNAPKKCPTCGAWGETFQWFPPVYWLEALDPAEALEQLRKTPLEVAALIEGLNEEAMTRPADDGGWAIRNVVSHLRDAQGVLDFRIDLFLKWKYLELSKLYHAPAADDRWFNLTLETILAGGGTEADARWYYTATDSEGILQAIEDGTFTATGAFALYLTFARKP